MEGPLRLRPVTQFVSWSCLYEQVNVLVPTQTAA